MALSNKLFKSDEAFSEISRELVKMNRKAIGENNIILKGIIRNKIVELMKSKDRDFKEMFEDVMYGGSFYKNLKVSKPDEYDLNLVVKLPISYNLLKIEPDCFSPGYVKIRVLDKNFSRYENFWANILDGDYLDQNKFRSWIQSVLDKVLADFRQNADPSSYIIKCARSTYRIRYRQSGPAFTITVRKVNDPYEKEISFDLVPCLLFRDERHIPGFRAHVQKWIAIAKPLHQVTGNYVQLLWRAGFYDDEKKILAGHKKPVIRLFKKLRDVKGWYQLKSYFIETLFLNEFNNTNFANSCERASRTNVFMYMLRVLQQKLSAGVLFNYWNAELNMLDDLPRLKEIANELQTIINRIDHSILTDPDILLRIFELRS